MQNAQLDNTQFKLLLAEKEIQIRYLQLEVEKLRIQVQNLTEENNKLKANEVTNG